MNAVAFDTLKTARALEGSGIPRAHAEAIAEQLAEGRTVDLSHLATRDELKHEVALLRADMRDLESRMTIKLGGMLVVITGILLAAIRYLPAAH